MAKPKEVEETTTVAGPKITKKPEVEGVEKKAGVGRAIIIKDPDGGEDIKRADWIRRVIQDPDSEFYCSRSKIAKKLTEIQGKDVPYQIVFAATKDFKIERPPKPVKSEATTGDGQAAAGGQAEDPLEGAESA
jgi:hypothetical protein